MMLPDTTPDFDTVEATAAFVDLAGYSILTEICGDHEAAQLAQRCHVAVHAEDAIGDDHRARTGGAREPRAQRCDVAMRVPREPRATREPGIEQRGVVVAVLEHAIAALEQRGDDGEVRHVSGREQQRARSPDECRELVLERVVLAAVPAHEV